MATTVRTRIRINHSHTLKEGWRLSETTVEVEFDTDEMEAGIDYHGLLAGLSDTAFVVGEAEAARRRGETDAGGGIPTA